MTVINTLYTKKEQNKQDLIYMSSLIFRFLYILSIIVFYIVVLVNLAIRKEFALPVIPTALGIIFAVLTSHFEIKTQEGKSEYNRLMNKFEGQKILHQKLMKENELKLLFAFEDENGKITKETLSLANMKKSFKLDISEIEINFDDNVIYYPVSDEVEIKDENIKWNKKYLKKKNKLLVNILVETVIIKSKTLIYLSKKEDGSYEAIELSLKKFKVEENKNYQEVKVDCEKKMIYLPYKEKDGN